MASSIRARRKNTGPLESSSAAKFLNSCGFDISVTTDITALKKLADIYNNSIGSFIDGIASVFGGKEVGKITYKEIGLVKFEEGGLANFTGPAWLDGTPSRPEYILNADQTERFFTLVDVLDSFKDKDASSSKSGDNYFEIEINVEKLENDYDVEKIEIIDEE